LFEGSPIMVAISRPEYRPETLRGLEARFAADVIAHKAKSKRTICGNKECETELTGAEKVFACVQIPDADRMILGLCPVCATKSTDDIFAMLQNTFDQVDHRVSSETVHTIAKMPLDIYAHYDVGDVTINVASPDNCDVAVAFAALLRAKSLPQFSLFFYGHSNCHQLIEALRADFMTLGIAEMFTYKTGSSKLIASEYDPRGLHSWIEADGWVVDKILNGADVETAKPVIVIQRINEFYAWRQLTDIHDIEWGQSKAA